MQSLTAAEILDTWERALNEAPASRPVSLLTLAARGSSREELARLPLGERDALLLDLREQTFGSRFSCLADCPECGGALELEFDTDEIRFSPPEKSEEPLRIEDRGLLIECRLPDSNDLAAIAKLDDAGAARRRLFERCLLAARDASGRDIPADELESGTLALVATRMGEADPQADVQLTLVCPACSHQWNAPLDIAAFLWTELRSFAERLLGEVHELAAAYGWSENEILELTPTRRALYLEMIRA